MLVDPGAVEAHQARLPQAGQQLLAAERFDVHVRRVLLVGELLAEPESVGRQADGHVGGDCVGDPIRAVGPILLEQGALEAVLGEDLVAVEADHEVARRVRLKSGSLAFKHENEIKDGHDIIGQFGVGFYAAFMVADVVTVISKSLESDNAYKWVSEGVDGYTIEQAEKDSVGTEIILKIKENTEDDNYDEFLEEYRLTSIIKKYSDFIRYPIKMDVTEK